MLKSLRAYLIVGLESHGYPVLESQFESLSFTTDIWSSSSYSFISLIAHGINQEWKREKFVLAIRELPGSHTGEVINSAIKQILAEWDISKAPSTSVASEQLFSHAREVFHYKRGQLDSYNAEQLIFLNRALH
uniref:HAT C-terminal dimerisation domain-containing protein n=1 Tax=Ditylenchus dipsaci TaxID=166011 RepID=A0A915CVE8_9BILA